MGRAGENSHAPTDERVDEGLGGAYKAGVLPRLCPRDERRSEMADPGIGDLPQYD